MPRFYATFGQKSPFCDGYVVIVADSYDVAHDEAMCMFGTKWSALYSEADGQKNREMKFEFFPAGQIGRTIELPIGYKHDYDALCM